MRMVMTTPRFRYVFVAYIVYASIKTMATAAQIAAAHGAHTDLLRRHLYALAGVEVAAALGMLMPRVASLASVVLLGVFAVAAAIDLSFGDVPAHLVLYATITLLLRGPVAAVAGANASRSGAGCADRRHCVGR